jgi:hypothetical protein
VKTPDETTKAEITSILGAWAKGNDWQSPQGRSKDFEAVASLHRKLFNSGASPRICCASTLYSYLHDIRVVAWQNGVPYNTNV